MVCRLPITALLIALIFVSSGCNGDKKEEPLESTVSSDIQDAVDRLNAFARQQMEAAEQARQANNYNQLQQAVDQQQQIQQQAQPYQENAQDPQLQQAISDYFEARTRANQQMTQIIKDEREQSAEDLQRYEEQREQERYEQERLQQQRIDELYQQQRDEARRQQEEANSF